MSISIARLGAACVFFLGVGAVQAGAQELTNCVTEETDWCVYLEQDPTECWVASEPKEMVNTRDGQVRAVRRGTTLLFVSYRPGSNVKGEVAFTGGYPFREGSNVTLEVGDSSFDLFTEGEYAWPGSPAEDAQIVAALKAGSRAVVKGVSGRGTNTADTFSLIGFTKALEEAERRCSG